MMIKNLITITFICFILSIPIVSIDSSGEAALHVGANDFDYDSIQDAINNATEDDTIIVHQGIYSESIRVYKKLDIIAESDVVLEYNGSNDIIDISADNCRITGFIIQNGDNTSFSAINIESDGNIIENNIIRNNQGNGLFMYYSANNIISNNTFVNDSICIVGDKNDWKSYEIINNTVNDRPLLYYKNQDNITLSSFQTGQIILANCSFFLIHNISLSKGDQAMNIGFSNNNIISDNNLSDNRIGIHLQYSDNNIVEHNSFTGNAYGLYITHSFSNTVHSNLFLRNTIFGCWICCNSKLNILFNNTFMFNDKNAYDLFNNTWHENGIGNFWSDYTGEDTDHDGIGNSPYNNIYPDHASSRDPFPIVDYGKIKKKSVNDTYGFTLLVIVIALIVVVSRMKK